MVECVFCDLVDVAEFTNSNDHAVAFRDAYAVSIGHTLVIPKMHNPDLFTLPRKVRLAVWELVDEVQIELRAQLKPDGFNVGINVGKAAGQTVFHAHVHIIPRWIGDVEDPRGGIRWVLPDRARYWV